jgi:hypothetical protein
MRVVRDGEETTHLPLASAKLGTLRYFRLGFALADTGLRFSGTLHTTTRVDTPRLEEVL